MPRSPRYHVIFDIDRCKPETVTDRAGLDGFLRRVVASVHMNILTGPVVVEGVPENPGITGFAVLDFSHAAAHTFTANGDVMIDIFSCKPFDKDAARALCMAYFATPESQVRSQEIWWE